MEWRFIAAAGSLGVGDGRNMSRIQEWMKALKAVGMFSEIPFAKYHAVGNDFVVMSDHVSEALRKVLRAQGFRDMVGHYYEVVSDSMIQRRVSQRTFPRLSVLSSTLESCSYSARHL